MWKWPWSWGMHSVWTFGALSPWQRLVFLPVSLLVSIATCGITPMINSKGTLSRQISLRASYWVRYCVPPCTTMYLIFQFQRKPWWWITLTPRYTCRLLIAKVMGSILLYSAPVLWKTLQLPFNAAFAISEIMPVEWLKKRHWENNYILIQFLSGRKVFR